jgi:hypothetical protein
MYLGSFLIMTTAQQSPAGHSHTQSGFFNEKNTSIIQNLFKLQLFNKQKYYSKQQTKHKISSTQTTTKMKKLLMAFTALVMLTCSAAMAQDTTMHKKMHTQKMGKMHDHIMMKDGKMWVMKDGKHMQMKETMTLKNGTMVMTDGTVKMADGKTSMMKNGDMINMEGKMHSMKMMKKRMKTMKKDSTSVM